MGKNIFIELWLHRSLILLFAINGLKLRYKNSALGFVWSFLEPLLMLTVLYFVFTNIIKTEIENYPIFLLIGLIAWYMFSRATSMGQNSLLVNAPIIHKINIRHEIFVISSCITSLFMMALEFSVFVIFLIILQFTPGISIIILPILFLDLFLLSLGFAMILAVATSYFKDIQFIWQVILQAGFFLSPIIYSLDLFPENIRLILKLNPMVPILDAIHNVTLYDTIPTTDSIIYMIIPTLLVLIIGYLMFKKFDKRIAEVL